tara:strand:+ start:163 stop:942 length:780 start_codon:yes stop_codon:yes gene_type:complete
MKNENRKIILKSLNKPNWARQSRYVKCHDHIVAGIDRSGYKTGLSAEEQKTLEKELGYEEGHLAPHSTFFKEYAVTVTDKPLHLDLDRAQDQLDYALIKASPRCANSVNELANWPKAEYVVYDQEEDARRENASIDLEVKALHTFAELSSSEKRDYLKLMGKASGNMSDSVATNILFKIAKDDPTAFNRITDMADFAPRLLIYNLISSKIVTVKGGHYYYQEIILGHGEQDAASYLEDPQNQELKIALKAKLTKTKNKK